MRTFAVCCCRFIFALLALCLGGCIEIEEARRFDPNGEAHLYLVIKVDPQYESLVFHDLDRQLRADAPPGVRIDSSQRIDGKAAFVIEADGPAAAELGAKEYPAALSISSGGFMKRRYDYRVSVSRTPQMPIPHRLRVTLPGSIEQTNGSKISGDTVEFDLTHARRGATFTVSSMAWAFDFGGTGSPSALSGVANDGWLLPASLALIGAGIVALAIGLIRRRRSPKVAVPLATSVSQPRDTATVATSESGVAGGTLFCTECGAKNPSSRRFCSACGQALE